MIRPRRRFQLLNASVAHLVSIALLLNGCGPSTAPDKQTKTAAKTEVVTSPAPAKQQEANWVRVGEAKAQAKAGLQILKLQQPFAKTTPKPDEVKTFNDFERFFEELSGKSWTTFKTETENHITKYKELAENELALPNCDALKKQLESKAAPDAMKAKVERAKVLLDELKLLLPSLFTSSTDLRNKLKPLADEAPKAFGAVESLRSKQFVDAAAFKKEINEQLMADGKSFKLLMNECEKLKVVDFEKFSSQLHEAHDKDTELRALLKELVDAGVVPQSEVDKFTKPSDKIFGVFNNVIELGAAVTSLAYLGAAALGLAVPVLGWIAAAFIFLAVLIGLLGGGDGEGKGKGNGGTVPGQPNAPNSSAEAGNKYAGSEKIELPQKAKHTADITGPNDPKGAFHWSFFDAEDGSLGLALQDLQPAKHTFHLLLPKSNDELKMIYDARSQKKLRLHSIASSDPTTLKLPLRADFIIDGRKDGVIITWKEKLNEPEIATGGTK